MQQEEKISAQDEELLNIKTKEEERKKAEAEKIRKDKKKQLIKQLKIKNKATVRQLKVENEIKMKQLKAKEAEMKKMKEEIQSLRQSL